MSFQQRIIRTKKFMKAYRNYNSCSVDSEHCLNVQIIRDVLWSLDSLTLSLGERSYLDTRWSMYQDYLSSGSVSELAFKMEIAKCSTAFTPLDYIVLMVGFSLACARGLDINHEVLIEMIDKHTWFDDAARNPKCLKILLKVLSMQHDLEKLKRTIAHILTKFPEMKMHNFMYRRVRNQLVSKFDDTLIKENF